MAASPRSNSNLKVDLGETTDIATANPEVMRRIESYLKTARTEPGPQGGVEIGMAFPILTGTATAIPWLRRRSIQYQCM